MDIDRIYQPIAGELKKVEAVLESFLKDSKHPSIVKIGKFLLESPGKRIRPALVILSAKASSRQRSDKCDAGKLITIAAAVELIHIASLIHDDIIDRAGIRHNKPSINSTWGNDVSVIFGDYVYSQAFELISKCSNPDIFSCFSEAVNVMCEGELIQVCQRGNAELSKDSYIGIVEKKTASFFAACCQAGAIVSNKNSTIQAALKEYGLNFGIAFQIVDDCKDIISEQSTLGKRPGQDMMMGEVTLPLMNLLDTVSPAQRVGLISVLESRVDQVSLERIRKTFLSSDAACKTKETASHYVECAKQSLAPLDNSDYKAGLNYLADYITQGALLNFVS